MTAVDAVRRDDGWMVRAEVVGPRVMTPDEVRSAETKTSKSVAAPVSLSVRCSTDLTVSGKGYGPVGGIVAPVPDPVAARP